MASIVHARKLQAIGVQLYTVRSILPEKPAETLRALDAMGYREVEGNIADLPKIVAGLNGLHMKLVSLHMDIPLILKGKDEDLSRAFAETKKAGASYAVFPYLPPANRGGLDAIRLLAESLNRAGEKCRAEGLKFCYHNHAFEFEPIQGTTPLEVMMNNTDKKAVGLELDAFWVSVAGHDPVEMINKYAGRVHLMHLKDKAEGTPVMYKESPGKAAFKEIGNGVLDWAKVLRAASAAGVEHYFVEQDQTPGDPLDSLRQSIQYLKKLDY